MRLENYVGFIFYLRIFVVIAPKEIKFGYDYMKILIHYAH
jgi:hypothetical protein